MTLTPDERAVLLAASTFMADGRQVQVLPLGELRGRTGLDRSQAHEAVERLRERGWLVCTGGLHSGDRDGCILMGEGLRRAKALAARRRRPDQV
jgi:hypothetical protein